MRFLVATFGHLASWVTIIVALFADQFGEIGQFKYALILLVTLFGGYAVWASWKEGRKNVYKVCKTENQINRALQNWISDGGRICIVSRNMSWGNKREITDILEDKARNTDLEIYMETKTDLASSLEENGAKICYYGDTGFIPECRFTFRKFGSKDAELAIAHMDNAGNHVIYRFTASDGPVFHLAQDLAKSLANK